VIVPEMNKGQLKTLLRDQFPGGLPAAYEGFRTTVQDPEIEAAIEEALREPPRYLRCSSCCWWSCT
jgi:hypothetical protein